MKYLRLEGAAKEKANQIIYSRLYTQCKDIAKKLGELTSRSSSWANARYIFEDKFLKIDFEVYAMADEELRVFHKGKKVLLLDEVCNSPPNPQNPVIKVDEFKRFEVKTHELEAWQKRIENLCSSIPTNTPQ